jgi:cytochrome c
MKIVIRLTALTLLFAHASTLQADELDGETLATEKRCVACHDLDRNLLGPSYEAIAARHSANREVMVEVLAQKIIIGGAGNWGIVPMVPNEHVTLDEARAISRWILNLQ